MQSLHRPRRRSTQPLYRTLAGLTCLLGPCLWLILPLLVEAGSVSRIYGSAVILPSSIEPLCSAPQTCPEFWDLRPTEGSSIIYGNRAFSTDPTCRKSSDGGRTFTLCPTNYAITNVGREIDIPQNGAILSMMFEAIGANRCALDKSTDGGVSWTTVVIAAGAGLQCPSPSVNFPGESMRCAGAVCLAYVRRGSSGGQLDIYRSTDNGDTWAIVSAGAVPSNCTLAQGIYFDGLNGIATCQRNLSAEAVAARKSVDGGSTWANIVSPAAPTTDYCSIATILPGFDTGLAMACYNNGGTLDQVRFLSSNANVLIPSSQPIPEGAYAPSSNPQMFHVAGNKVLIIALHSGARPSRVLRTDDGGQNVYEIAESLNGTFRPTRLMQVRAYQGALMMTSDASGISFSLIQPD